MAHFFLQQRNRLLSLPCISTSSPTGTRPPPSSCAQAGAKTAKCENVPSPTSPGGPAQRSPSCAGCSPTPSSSAATTPSISCALCPTALSQRCSARCANCVSTVPSPPNARRLLDRTARVGETPPEHFGRSRHQGRCLAPDDTRCRVRGSGEPKPDILAGLAVRFFPITASASLGGSDVDPTPRMRQSSGTAIRGRRFSPCLFGPIRTVPLLLDRTVAAHPEASPRTGCRGHRSVMW